MKIDSHANLGEKALRQSFTSCRQDLISSAEMPPPQAYEDEYQYWPWGKLIKRAVDIIVEAARPNATITDYMCATGRLLSDICERRPDLTAMGCDIHLPFVTYANTNRPRLDVVHADARSFRLTASHDIIVCTAGLHHLKFEEQEHFIQSLSNASNESTLIVIGEEMLAPYNSEQGRARAAVQLNTELLYMGIEEDWPDNLLSAGLLCLSNDLLLRGEYKRDLQRWVGLLEKYFRIDDLISTWAPATGGGDALFICRLK
jgi:hypothetical protein